MIVAAGAVPFKDDTRRQLADAIDQAETEKAKGVLTLTLQGGRKVDLQLKVLGTYSGTAPYHCPKTDAIITRAADSMIKAKDLGKSGLPIDLLGLLATGEPKCIDVAKDVIHAAPWAKPDLALSIDKYNTAISLLASLNIEGGIEFAFDTLEAEGGKAGFKIRMLMDVLPKYGAAAKYALPKIKAVNAGKFQKQWDAMIKQIESATETRKMISLEQAKQAGLQHKTAPAASEPP